MRYMILHLLHCMTYLPSLIQHQVAQVMGKRVKVTSSLDGDLGFEKFTKKTQILVVAKH